MRAEPTLKRFVFLTLALVFALGATAGDAAAKKPWEKFKYPELGDITIPDYERHVLANGMTVFLLEDHTWPLVEGQAIIRTGGAFEPLLLQCKWFGAHFLRVEVGVCYKVHGLTWLP